MLALPATAPAATLTPTSAPLPGSAFQAADGDQAPAPPLTDWSAYQSAGRVLHAPDPNAQDSAFKGGRKEGEPGDWDLTTESGGVNPAKANIRDLWAAPDQPGGRSFLYAAFTREASEGTSYLAIELNRSGRLWDNGRARIPCRQTGDVLLTFGAAGNTLQAGVERWVTTRTNVASGCAAAGRLERQTDLRPNVDVQGAMNAAAIANSLPGAYGGSIPSGRFGEAGIDLAAVLESQFDDDCLAFTSVWAHSRSSDSEISNLQDYVAPAALDLRTCAASGTKFFDLDADGVRDPGEPGLPRFRIFADYDGDGQRDPAEPFAITDDDGRYVIDDIRPPGGTYTIREVLPTGRDWRCSFPAPCVHGPIDVAAEPYARGRDFGNWYPARLTVRKRLSPPTDPGRFDISVNGQVVLPAAGDGAETTLAVPPGSYTVSEPALPGYTSSVICKRGTRRAQQRTGTVFESVTLQAGERAICTFFNNGPGPAAPAIAIDKTGPAIAPAGSTLAYRIYVTNVGEVTFPAADVDVSDSGCDQPPVRVDPPAATPGGLDPGETWTYRCTRSTAPPGDRCVLRVVSNTASVGAGGVEDDVTIETVLVCPPRPPGPGPGPEPETPGTTEPGEGPAPPGPTPPQAGTAGAAGVASIPRCVRRGTRITLRLARVARVRVSSGGERVRGLAIRPLQSRVVIVVRRAFPPGRYLVRARVVFQRGSGTAPLTLRRRIRACASAAPRFTG